MLPSFDVLVAQLQERLTDPLPGHDAHLTMAPRSPVRREALSVEGRDCREAGVLVLLLPQEGTPSVVLTVRHDALPNHAGQVSFPGGQREENESLQCTALREAWEEVDLAPASVQTLGALTPLFVPPSNFCVHPFVGAVSHDPALRPTDREVDEILRVPLTHLLDPSNRSIKPWSLQDSTVRVPYYDVAGQTVWGATAMMLAELLVLVQELPPSD